MRGAAGYGRGGLVSLHTSTLNGEYQSPQRSQPATIAPKATTHNSRHTNARAAFTGSGISNPVLPEHSRFPVTVSLSLRIGPAAGLRIPLPPAPGRAAPGGGTPASRS